MPGWVSRLLALVAFLGWALFARLAVHRSRSPEYLGRYSPEYLLFLGLVLLLVLALTALAIVGHRHPAALRIVRFGAALGLTCGATAVSLIAAEVLVRSVDLLGVSMFEEVTRYVLDLEADDALVYKHRADLDTVYQGVPFRTNGLGLRDRPVPEPSPDLLRVLVLGDSVTLGWGVPVEATFARQLEPALEARVGRRVHSINAGVSGYNTQQELAFLKRHVVSMAPDLVVLVYVENDVEPQARNMLDMRERWENPPGASAWLLRWSWLYRLVHFVVPDHVGASARPPDTTGWTASMEALAEAQRVARGRGVPFATFLFRMLPDDVTDALQRDIARVAEAEGFPFFDTLSWFDGVSIRSVINSFVDTHPNAEGHRIVAEGIARTLAESGALCRVASLRQLPACRDGGATRLNSPP